VRAEYDLAELKKRRNRYSKALKESRDKTSIKLRPDMASEGIMPKTELERRIEVMQAKAVRAMKEAVTETLKDHAKTGDPVETSERGRARPWPTW